MPGRTRLSCGPGWNLGDRHPSVPSKRAIQERQPRVRSTTITPTNESCAHALASHRQRRVTVRLWQPNAYFCHQVIPAIKARTGRRFSYVPVLLGGLFKLANNRSPAEALAGIPNKQAYDRLEVERFVKAHGLAAYRSGQ